MMHIIEMIFDEAVEELVDADVSDEMMSKWIFWFGKLFEWCATGELADLPDDMRDILADFIEPAPAPVMQKTPYETKLADA